MWKKAFIRLTFVLMLATVSVLVVLASKTKISASVETCPNGNKECCKSSKEGDNMMIWESVSRTILGSVQF